MSGIISDAARIIGEMSSNTKEEAFIKGYMMGMGSLVSDEKHPPDFDLVAEDPVVFIPIEVEILKIRAKVTHDQIEEAKSELRKIYEMTGRAIPYWIK